MDFFAQQDKARRNTTWLVVLFLVAVAALVLITNLLVILTVWSMNGNDIGALSAMNGDQLNALFTWERFGMITLAVTGVILCAMAYKWLQLAEGGKRIAESLGGRRIQPNTEDPDEVRALNVVEEMAIAAGMPVPPVYLLEYEPGINAFAAGNSPKDAVVGLTRGCIEQLERSQLQGVVAHEFSHILNGDMRLNLRLIALLHGLLFVGIVGEMLLRGSSRSHRHSSSGKRSGGQLMLLGLGLLVIGWLGTFFGKVIKASVNRQREFLADASAVQFTRNPEGIAGALKVIGGYTSGTELGNLNASEVSHLFFGRSLTKLTGLFATHPPLVDRIMRIEPQWDGSYIRTRPRPAKQRATDDSQSKSGKLQRVMDAAILGGIATAGAASAGGSAGLSLALPGGDALPSRLQQHARDPLGAVALVYSLLASDDDPVWVRQLEIIDQTDIAGLKAYCQRLRPQVQVLAAALRLPLIELALPALKCMSAGQYPRFKNGLMLLIKADDRVDLFEWCLYQLVRQYLAPEHEKPRPSKNRYTKPPQVAEEFRLVLSMLAHHGHGDPVDAERAFHRGAGCANLYNLKPLPAEECNLDAFIKAVNKLADCQPILKPRLLKGLERCAKQDGAITTVERELITTIAAVMDSPVPNLKTL